MVLPPAVVATKQVRVYPLPIRRIQRVVPASLDTAVYRTSKKQQSRPHIKPHLPLRAVVVLFGTSVVHLLGTSNYGR